MPPLPPRLIAITDRKLAGGTAPLLRRCEELLEIGLPAIMLREKDLPARDLYAMAVELRAATDRYGALLIINGRADVAMAALADGVQLGRDALPPEAAQPILPQQMLLGVSCHSVEDIHAAEAAGASYTLLAPIFDPASKARERPPLGLEGLRHACAEATRPVLALGGIGAQNAPAVREAGAYGAAAIGCFFSPGAQPTEAERLLEVFAEDPRQP